jgi:hypothetical protein
MGIFAVTNPYQKGILKVAPIKVSIDDSNLSIDTIRAYAGDNGDLLEELTDIVDICGINPSSIKMSKNTQSSEESGRDASLNMHKDILGRVRDFTITFPIMSDEKFQELDNMFMNKTEVVFAAQTSTEADLTENKFESFDGNNTISVSYIPSMLSSDDYDKADNPANSVMKFSCNINKYSKVNGLVSRLSLDTGFYGYELVDLYNKAVKEGKEYAILQSYDAYGDILFKIDTSSKKITFSINTTENNDAYIKLYDVVVKTYDEQEVVAGVSDFTSSREYIIWYLVQILTPEGEQIKDVFYVGDSSFTDVENVYIQRNVPILDDKGNATGASEVKVFAYAKNVTLNLIGKTALSRG